MHPGSVQEGPALLPPTHSSKRKAGQGHVHEAIVPAEATAAGPGQHLFDHLGEKGKVLKHTRMYLVSVST